MGLMIITKKDGRDSGLTASEFKHKVKSLKRLAEEICEDTESMIEEYGGEYGERGSYRDGGYGERGHYRDDYEHYGERRRY